MTVVAKVRSHRTMIVMTPPPLDFMPKKMTDQTALIASWIQKRTKASNAPFVDNPFCQTRKTEIPINTYKVVQTGPNVRFGGVKRGFFRLAYQVGIALNVKRLPMPPAAKLAKMLTTSLTMLFESKLPLHPCNLFWSLRV